ncbi:MAG: hypothetical protein AAGA16_21360, partial [Cyanobacteria bacterium P01_E01_bin.35]
SPVSQFSSLPNMKIIMLRYLFFLAIAITAYPKILLNYLPIIEAEIVLLFLGARISERSHYDYVWIFRWHNYGC